MSDCHCTCPACVAAHPPSDDPLVEAAARAIWQANDDEVGIEFNSADDEEMEWYRREARAALKAVQDAKAPA